MRESEMFQTKTPPKSRFVDTFDTLVGIASSAVSHEFHTSTYFTGLPTMQSYGESHQK